MKFGNVTVSLLQRSTKSYLKVFLRKKIQDTDYSLSKLLFLQGIWGVALTEQDSKVKQQLSLDNTSDLVVHKNMKNIAVRKGRGRKSASSH